jgi:hypothetical protein
MASDVVTMMDAQHQAMLEGWTSEQAREKDQCKPASVDDALVLARLFAFTIATYM